MKTFKLAALSLFALFTLAACGGGGSAATPPTKTTVTGIASKGLITNGIVRIYAVINGAKGDLLAQVSTDDNGNYSADIGSYVGPILAEASGPYLDEATGTTKIISADAPIHAALPVAQGSVILPVTALTELAVVKTGGTLTPAAITTANNLVSDVFKVDIINTLPVAPTATALATATQAQTDYTLALATVSQVSNDTGISLASTLTTMAQGISATGMTSETAATVQTALTTFVTGNKNNTTGVTSTTETNLVNVGSNSKSYSLVLQGTVASGAVKGIQFDLTFPAGVTLNIDTANGAILSSSLALAGNTPANSLLASKYASGTANIGIITTSGINAGTFAAITCNIASGTTAPAATAFSVANLKVIDENGGTIPGVSVVVQ